jgi:hypothetical protein
MKSFHLIVETAPDHDARYAAASPREARDWKAFFEALASFAATLLPIVVPLFKAEDKK